VASTPKALRLNWFALFDMIDLLRSN